MLTSNRSGPALSVIIPTHNNCFFTRLCLQALRASRKGGPSFETIVVDNGSSDATPAVLAAFANGVARVVMNTTNAGYAAASNQGAAVASGQFLVFLNNDVVVEPGCLKALLELAQSDSTIGVVGARLLYPDGTLQHAGIAFDSSLAPRHILPGYPGDWPEATHVREYQAVTGACLLIGKALFDDIGGFDEGYLNSFEDIDLCFKVRRLGSRVLYCPDAVAHHFESATPGRFSRDDCNIRRFVSTWGSDVRADYDPMAAQLPKPRGVGSLMRLELDSLAQRARSLGNENEHLRRQLADRLPQALDVFQLEGASDRYAAETDLIYCPAPVPILTTGQSTCVPVTVVNCGRRTWSRDQLRLSYHWRRTGEVGYAERDGWRTDFDGDLDPGAFSVVQARLVSPSTPGSYVLEWDAVEEGVAWLSERGVVPYRQRVDVVETCRDVICIEGLPTSLVTGDLVELRAELVDRDTGECANGDGSSHATIGWTWVSPGWDGPLNAAACRRLDANAGGGSLRPGYFRFAVQAPRKPGTFRLQLARWHPRGVWLPVKSLGGEVHVQGTGTPSDEASVADPRLNAEEDSNDAALDSIAAEQCRSDEIDYYRRRLRAFAYRSRETSRQLEEGLAEEQRIVRLLAVDLHSERDRTQQLASELDREHGRVHQLGAQLQEAIEGQTWLQGKLQEAIEGQTWLQGQLDEARAARSTLATELHAERERTGALELDLVRARELNDGLNDLINRYRDGRLMRLLASVHQARTRFFGSPTTS